MRKLKNRMYYFSVFLILTTTNVEAMLSYRCEHQASQNAAQFPMDSYYYIVFDRAVSFNNYKIMSYHKDKINSILEYSNGSTKEISFAEGKIVETKWGSFNKKFILFKNQIDPLLSLEDKALRLTSLINLDFLSRLNEPLIYHSIQLRPSDMKLKSTFENVKFQFVRPDTDIEKQTLLPGDKVEYKIANKNILFNERTGMLMQVEVKVNTSFLRYVFVCQRWELSKIPTGHQLAGLRNLDGQSEQFRLIENDLVQSKGQFSIAAYDLIFRAINNYYKENNLINDGKNEHKIKIINALMKSKILNDYMVNLNSEYNIQELQKEIKKQLLIFSQHHFPKEYGKVDTEVLARIYEDMYEVLLSYSTLLRKGYK